MKGAYHNYEGVTAWGCDWDRVAQLKSCRTSPVGGLSAGCFGSTSKLKEHEVSCHSWGWCPLNVPPAVKVLKIPMVSGVVESHIKVFLDFWNSFKVVGDLKSLHIWVGNWWEDDGKTSNKISPCTILASLWYLLKLSSFLFWFIGEARCEGLPSRQKVTSVR